MFDLFLVPQALPFAIALMVVAGLFLVEILSLLFGATILGTGADGPDAEFDLDTDFDLSTRVDIDVDLDAEPIDAELSNGAMDALTWLGIRDVPFLIWLVSFLTMFGLSGLIIQSIATSLLGTPLFTALAVVLAIPPALSVTRIIANWVALLMPKTESSAMRVRSMGGLRGTITQGTATRGNPAEAKVRDYHGNIHYLRVEPLEDEAVFPTGSDVILIRKRGDQFFVI